LVFFDFFERKNLKISINLWEDKFFLKYLYNNYNIMEANTKKVALTLIATTALLGLGLNSVSAAMWNGQWNGQGRTDRTIVDTNNNGIADGQEDWDNDGILNRDDDDYEKSYTNMRDDDNDGIANKDDEDYVRPQDGTNKPENAGNGNNAWKKMGNSMNSSDTAKKNQYKNAINEKYGTMISQLDQTKLQTISDKVDALLLTTTSEETKLVLIALKEIIDEQLVNSDLDIEGLLN